MESNKNPRWYQNGVLGQKAPRGEKDLSLETEANAKSVQGSPLFSFSQFHSISCNFISLLTYNVKMMSDSLFPGHVQKNEDRIDEALDPNLVSVVSVPDLKTKVVLKRVPVIARGHVIEIAAIGSGAVQKREIGILEVITQKKEDRCVREVLIIKESRG